MAIHVVFQAISRDIESKAMILDAVQTQSDTLLRDLGPQEKQTVVTQLESLVQKHKDLTVKAGEKQKTLTKVGDQLMKMIFYVYVYKFDSGMLFIANFLNMQADTSF